MDSLWSQFFHQIFVAVAGAIVTKWNRWLLRAASNRRTAIYDGNPNVAEMVAENLACDVWKVYELDLQIDVFPDCPVEHLEHTVIPRQYKSTRNGSRCRNAASQCLGPNRTVNRVMQPFLPALGADKNGFPLSLLPIEEAPVIQVQN
jgi:hypothetical protein